MSAAVASGIVIIRERGSERVDVQDQRLRSCRPQKRVVENQQDDPTATQNHIVPMASTMPDTPTNSKVAMPTLPLSSPPPASTFPAQLHARTVLATYSQRGASGECNLTHRTRQHMYKATALSKSTVRFSRSRSVAAWSGRVGSLSHTVLAASNLSSRPFSSASLAL